MASPGGVLDPAAPAQEAVSAGEASAEERVHLPLLPFQLSLLDDLVREDGVAVLAAGLGVAQVGRCLNGAGVIVKEAEGGTCGCRVLKCTVRRAQAAYKGCPRD